MGGPHEWENCVYAHTYRDFRRSPKLGYSSRPCQDWAASLNGPRDMAYLDRCPRGMACSNAHGAKEQLYHPQFYKTSSCKEANCTRAQLCAFNHGCHDRRSKPEREKVTSEALPGAAGVLSKEQPFYWSPPRYHAMEDPARGGFRFCGGSSTAVYLDMGMDGDGTSSARRGKPAATKRGPPMPPLLASPTPLQAPAPTYQPKHYQQPWATYYVDSTHPDAFATLLGYLTTQIDEPATRLIPASIGYPNNEPVQPDPYAAYEQYYYNYHTTYTIPSVAPDSTEHLKRLPVPAGKLGSNLAALSKEGWDDNRTPTSAGEWRTNTPQTMSTPTEITPRAGSTQSGQAPASPSPASPSR
eukprot:TRINITY_DN7690_c0_g1_i1.p2 TRINITY_DN7690_c0_g1~~TRINITY_DN7690_c0_g1_i1.p2  ORF type:complete len:355 (-),score=60.67 TRINITY_DN7690_c0_g1_i1:395-1459(-)